jgi:predicted nuclease of restriction endonuclease-like (RecB) superfamily
MELSSNYAKFLNEIRQKINSARLKAVRSVNKAQMQLYWEIGKTIIERQSQHGWGKSVVERLAKDLSDGIDSSTGYSPQNLWYMRQFYIEYKDSANLQQLVGEIPWGQNILIFSKIKDKTEREYYLKECARFGWSRNVLLNQIKADVHHLAKTKSKQHNFEKVLPAHLAEQADESIKDVITLDFLGIKKPFLERELEKKLIEKIKQFMLELGTGFAFIGNQHRLTIEDNEYFVDLLFFNRKLKCLVAVELKTGKFEPEYAGKMDFYLHLLNEQTKMEGENPPIGIILCANKSGLVVEYALRSVKHAVGVAEYQITGKLPKELSKYLPSQKKFAEGLNRLK